MKRGKVGRVAAIVLPFFLATGDGVAGDLSPEIDRAVTKSTEQARKQDEAKYLAECMVKLHGKDRQQLANEDGHSDNPDWYRDQPDSMVPRDVMPVDNYVGCMQQKHSIVLHQPAGQFNASRLKREFGIDCKDYSHYQCLAVMRRGSDQAKDQALKLKLQNLGKEITVRVNLSLNYPNMKIFSVK